MNYNDTKKALARELAFIRTHAAMLKQGEAPGQYFGRRDLMLGAGTIADHAAEAEKLLDTLGVPQPEPI